MPLPTPEGKQAEVVAMDSSGHAVVLGTAGSGKTTMAIHRAAYLANPMMEHSGRTLLVTYNNALVSYLDYLQPPGLSEIDIRNYHKFALGYLRSRAHRTDNTVCGAAARRRLIGEAIDKTKAEFADDALLARPQAFFEEEIAWISHHGIDSVEDYVRVERVGRSQAGLQRSRRPLMFQVYQTYLGLRGGEGKLYDWEDVAMAARRELQRDTTDRMYRHVVVDEGQDFSPEMLRSLALGVPEDGSVTVFADVAQQIYGRRISWKDAGLSVTVPWKFDRNYRNSPQIAAFALAIAEMPYYGDEPDIVAPTGFSAEGPPPTVVSFGDGAAETAFVIDQAVEAARDGTVGVLLRRNFEAAQFARRIPDAILLDRHLRRWGHGPGVYCGTIHAAKGLEFDTVILPRVSRDSLPDPTLVARAGEADAEADDGRLVYVAVTRARQSLILTHHGVLTALLPENDHLWQELRR